MLPLWLFQAQRLLRLLRFWCWGLIVISVLLGFGLIYADHFCDKEN